MRYIILFITVIVLVVLGYMLYSVRKVMDTPKIDVPINNQWIEPVVPYSFPEVPDDPNIKG